MTLVEDPICSFVQTPKQICNPMHCGEYYMSIENNHNDNTAHQCIMARISKRRNLT